MPHLFHGRLRAIYYLNASASKPRSLAYKQGFPSQISVSTSLCFYLFVKLSTYNRYDFFESTNTQSKQWPCYRIDSIFAVYFKAILLKY